MKYYGTLRHNFNLIDNIAREEYLDETCAVKKIATDPKCHVLTRVSEVWEAFLESC